MEDSANYYDPDKSLEFAELYRLISLLPVLSKLFEIFFIPEALHNNRELISIT